MDLINKFVKKLKTFCYRKMWYELLYIFAGDKYNNIFENYIGVKKAVLLMEPQYGNLGDQAIAYASELFIKDNFKEYTLIRVTEKKTCSYLKAIKRVLTTDDIVFIQGGGNMGSLYPYIERMRRFCVRKLPKQKIVCLPVSIFYENSYKAQKELKADIKVYKKHNNLTIFARDENSLLFLRDKYPNLKSELVPDMVFYLAGKIQVNADKGNYYLLCLRKELESAIGKNGREALIRRIKSKYDQVIIGDTTISRTVDPDFRDMEVDSLFRTFSAAKCIITDRMHGMIIAALVGTPCVVLKSLDTKIVGSSYWIRDLDYIHIVEKPTEENIINSIIKLTEKGDIKPLKLMQNEFKKMKEYIVVE